MSDNCFYKYFNRLNRLNFYLKLTIISSIFKKTLKIYYLKVLCWGINLLLICNILTWRTFRYDLRFTYYLFEYTSEYCNLNSVNNLSKIFDLNQLNLKISPIVTHFFKIILKIKPKFLKISSNLYLKNKSF